MTRRTGAGDLNAAAQRSNGTRWAPRAVLTLMASLVSLSAFGIAAPASAAKARPAPAGTIFVTNLDTNTVSVISPVSHAVRTITSSRLNGPLGIAITPNARTAFVTNSLGNSVVPINLVGGASVGPLIRVGKSPAAIAITPKGDTAYVTNFDSNTVTPINLRASPPRPGRPVRVGAGPWSVAVTPNASMVLVSNSESTTVSLITVRTRAVRTVAVGPTPGAIAVTPDGTLAFVTTGRSVAVIGLSGSTPRVIARIPVPDQPVGLAISPLGKMAYTANTDNSVTPIRLSTRRAGSPVAVGTVTQPDGIVISPNGRTAYIADASNSVTPVSLVASTVRPSSPVPVGSASFGIAIAPDQAPVAKLRIIPGKAGRATHFIATHSSAPNSTIVRYEWFFGDGKHKFTTKPRTSHVYARPGHYHAKVVEFTKYGTSHVVTFTGQTVSNNGAKQAVARQTFVVGSALGLLPGSGSPGERVSLVDRTFAARCRPVYVFFDGRLIGHTTPPGHLLDDSQLVVPGNATLGRHHFAVGCTTSRPFLLSANFEVIAKLNHLSEFSVAMPNWGEMKSHLAGAGGLGLLMLILSRLIGAGFPSEWIDRTYEENRERFTGGFRRRFPWLFIDRTQAKPLWRRILNGSAIFVAFVAVAGVINSFLDPNFGFNRTSMWLFIGQCLGIAVIELSTEFPIVVAGLARRKKIHLQVLVGGMFIAIACVAVSRLIGLSPGYCYGLIAVFMLRPEPDEMDDGKLRALSSTFVLLVATTAFFLTGPVFAAATRTHPPLSAIIMTPALNVIFLAGFASLAFGMFPLPFLAGRNVAKWSRPAWFMITLAGIVGFVAVLLSPGSGSSGEVHHIGLLPLIAAFVVFAIVSVSVMTYFHRHPHEHEHEHGAEHAAAGDGGELATGESTD